MTDYVYRGVERFDNLGNHEDAPNFQVDGYLSIDLGKLPHPFVGLFVNVFDSDPISNFQEVRPRVGFDWDLRPIIFTLGHNSYIFPDRDQINTNEVFGKITLDDSYFFKSDDPIFSPYIYGAYDYELNKGYYFELGVEHKFDLEDIGVVLTAQASVAYTYNQESFKVSPTSKDIGFQHYQFGLIGSYSINKAFDVSPRYGQWTFNGYLFYTDGIDSDLISTTQVWGGAGIGFSY
jgi:hypothetical protein